MNWLVNLLRKKKGNRRYKGDGFSVVVERGFRELLKVQYDAGGEKLNLGGELIGDGWRSVGVRIPQTIEREKAQRIADRLAEAFLGMGFLGYMIDRVVEVEVVPEEETQAAKAELEAMGLTLEVLPSGTVRQGFRAGVPRPSRDEAKKLGPRMMTLIQTVSGKRARIEILAERGEI